MGHLDKFHENDRSSVVRMNMLEDINYRPYCMKCTGLYRLDEWNNDRQLHHKVCGSTTSFPEDFLDRYEKSHSIKLK